ncbi:hypothetical protein N1851_006573 [Merluccius polli]|uniref:Uncharacterized protein n=1 Tax=Merluccius polli TaxID=89951 RepID=A0AA47PAA7_MERPO|nr:hypothetical protein N1851_006573 [Merluccius polli]
MFKYIEPKKVKLGNDENMTERFAYYVPVTQTLNSLLESDIWKNSVSQQSRETNPDDFCDISDGQNSKSNQFFMGFSFLSNPGCLKLILYQDAFEIVNPLGSAKKKHKVIAVYLSVANLPAHMRSNTVPCLINDLKQFGSAKVFSEMLEDLKNLEKNGITVGGETVKGALYCIAGDNLGSHSIGGFTENFSRSVYFCRYCEITRPSLRMIQMFVVHSVLLKVMILQFYKLKTDKAPGLPPCLGHDIFEGVLSYDVALYLKYFIKKNKWFTYSYKGSDALTKPSAVNSEGSKLSGQAIQNWNLLRLLPVLIGDKVQNPEDDVWQLTLQLKDIVDMICAQNISLSQVAYLDIIIQESVYFLRLH